MIWELTDEVWFGDKSSIAELGDRKVGSVINAAHRIRRPYWQNVGSLPWDVWYFRIAKPDREPADVGHLEVLSNLTLAIKYAGKLPVLCHCRMGGHRGPSTALFVAWTLHGCIGFEKLLTKVEELRPSYRRRGVFGCSIVAACREMECQYASSMRKPG